MGLFNVGTELARRSAACQLLPSHRPPGEAEGTRTESEGLYVPGLHSGPVVALMKNPQRMQAPKKYSLPQYVT